MTIKVEQETLLRVLDRQATQSSSRATYSSSVDYCLVDFRKPISKAATCSVENLPDSSFDDEDSVDTLSTASLSDSDSEVERRVSFADELVTEEWTRPFTPKEEIPNLFYSTEETQRFRQQYRLERKLLSDLSVNFETCPVDNEDLSSLMSPSFHRHRISRVVVLHNDRLETFLNPDADLQSKERPKNEAFFDSDSFWSGSITWY